MCDDDWGEGCATPEEAARGDVPERFFTVLGVQVDGDEAVVWSLTNDRPPFEAYVDNCVRRNGQWYATDGSGGLPAGAGTHGRSVTRSPASMRASKTRSPTLNRVVALGRSSSVVGG